MKKVSQELRNILATLTFDKVPEAADAARTVLRETCWGSWPSDAEWIELHDRLEGAIHKEVILMLSLGLWPHE